MRPQEFVKIAEARFLHMEEGCTALLDALLQEKEKVGLKELNAFGKSKRKCNALGSKSPRATRTFFMYFVGLRCFDLLFSFQC